MNQKPNYFLKTVNRICWLWYNLSKHNKHKYLSLPSPQYIMDGGINISLVTLHVQYTLVSISTLLLKRFHARITPKTGQKMHFCPLSSFSSSDNKMGLFCCGANERLLLEVLRFPLLCRIYSMIYCCHKAIKLLVSSSYFAKCYWSIV